MLWSLRSERKYKCFAIFLMYVTKLKLNFLKIISGFLFSYLQRLNHLLYNATNYNYPSQIIPTACFIKTIQKKIVMT
jgi:hypothetical protein